MKVKNGLEEKLHSTESTLKKTGTKKNVYRDQPKMGYTTYMDMHLHYSNKKTERNVEKKTNPTFTLSRNVESESPAYLEKHN